MRELYDSGHAFIMEAVQDALAECEECPDISQGVIDKLTESLLILQGLGND